jgi:hypothetical protein
MLYSHIKQRKHLVGADKAQHLWLDLPLDIQAPQGEYCHRAWNETNLKKRKRAKK